MLMALQQGPGVLLLNKLCTFKNKHVKVRVGND